MTPQESLNSDAGTVTIWTTAIVGIGYAFLKLIGYWGQTSSSNSKATAEASLYNTLSTQIKSHAELIQTLQNEKAEWLAEKVLLNARLKRLEETEIGNNVLKEKLEVKDKQITELINEVVRKTTEITELRERVHILEVRLHKDEASWCAECKFRRATNENDSK